MRTFHLVLAVLLALAPLAQLTQAQDLEAALQRPAETVQCKALMLTLSIAIKSYQFEYGKMPIAMPSNTDEHILLRSSGGILKMLGAEDTAANPRKIRFFDAPVAKNKRTGLYMDEKGSPILVDPWGEPFYYVLDLNEDGQIPNPDPRDNKLNPVIKSPVLIFSAGPDHDPKTWEDNVVSWK